MNNLETTRVSVQSLKAGATITAHGVHTGVVQSNVVMMGYRGRKRIIMLARPDGVIERRVWNAFSYVDLHN